MFVDASAIVAILTKEEDGDALVNILEGARAPITSPIALFEATLGLCRKLRVTVPDAEGDVREFLRLAGVDIVSITDQDAASALDAFSRYGKGRGHPAQLNMGDCFAYAVAKSHSAPLLFKGNDFIHTDIAKL